MINFDMKNYENDIIIDKKNRDCNSLLDNGYLIHENLNAGRLRCIQVCQNDNYGLTNIIFNIHASINITNEKIIESNTLWRLIKEPLITPYNTYLFMKYYKLNESIVHDIKLYCDQLLMMVFLYVEPNIVTDVPINSIGEYLYKKDGHDHMFLNDEKFLNLINDLDNSYKHSFSDIANPKRIGINDNCIVNYYCKDGKNITHPAIYSVKMNDIISGFNTFFDNVELFIKEYKKC